MKSYGCPYTKAIAQCYHRNSVAFQFCITVGFVVVTRDMVYLVCVTFYLVLIALFGARLLVVK